MANKIIQAVALPTGEQGQIIYIDNGDGTYTETVAFDRDTYPSRAADIVAGSTVLAVPTANSFIPGLPFLIPNATPVRVIQSSLAATDNDLYTCPVGKKAYFGIGGVYNTTVGSIAVFGEVKIGGTYFRLSASFNAGANALSVLGAGVNQGLAAYVLNAGEILAINAAAIGLNAFIKIVEFDATVPFRTVRINSLNLGDNDLYTCPSGVAAITLNVLQNNAVQGLQGSGVIVNASVGTPTYTGHIIQGAGASASTNQFGRAAALASNSTAALIGIPFLTATDRLVINSTSGAAGQSAFVTVYELPT